MPLAGGTFTGDVTFDSATNAGRDMKWDESESDLTFNDAAYIKMGDSDDLIIGHSGSYGFITQTGSKLTIGPTSNHAVELLYGNGVKLDTLTDGVRVTGRLYATGDIQIDDDDKIEIGSASGGDIQIYHDSSNNNSYIKETNGSGSLYINGTTLYLSNAANDKDYVTCTDGGSVAIKHNNSTKLETSSVGVNLTGSLKLNDGEIVRLGSTTYGDLKLYHTGSINIIDNAEGHTLHIRNNSAELAKFIPSGAVELFHNNVKTFKTTTDGITVLGSEGGASYIYMSADEGDDNADKWVHSVGTDGVYTLQNYTSGSWEKSIQSTGDAAVELYHNNVKQLATDAEGISLPKGSIKGMGGQILIIGGTMDPSADRTWSIPFNSAFHSGSNGYVFTVEMIMNHWNTGNYYKILDRKIFGRGNTTSYQSVDTTWEPGAVTSGWNNGHFDQAVSLSGSPNTLTLTYDADGTPAWTSGYYLIIKHSGYMGIPTIS